ncbi:TetR/AcrR family transcriptional regulator [candidate division KSB1 bacterium]|nr:TetR/AcrR family transcriptional regulator [candidate division KSB1 bacterium]
MGKKENILTVAQGLFGRFGLRKTTIDEIAKLARVAKGTIYKYFTNKEDVFYGVVKKESEFLVGKIREEISKVETPQQKMRTFVLTKMRYLKNLANLYNVTRENVSEFWPQAEFARKESFLEEKKIVQEILVDGITKGEFMIKNIEVTSFAIVTALKGLEYPWIIEDSQIAMEESIDLLLDILFKGIEKR